MFKKIISVLASAVMLLTVFDISAAVFAEPAEELSGSCGTSVTYTLTDNDGDGYYDKLVISGTGDMTDYTSLNEDDRPYFVQKEKPNQYSGDYNYYIKEIIINEGVTSVGDFAFLGFRGAERVSLPSTVTKIGEQSFVSDGNLREINLPSGLQSIGVAAFQYCSSLSSVTIPGGVRVIEQQAFDQSGLTSVTIPEGVEVIGVMAFSSCTSLTSVTLPSTLTSIGSAAFKFCAFTSIEIPDGVTNVGNNAFMRCDSLTQIIYKDGLDVTSANIPAEATQIKYEAAEGGVTISEIILGAGKTETDIPDAVCGMTVVGVAEDYRDAVSQSGHTHVNESEASCTQKAVCKFCGEYGDFAAHTGGTATCAAKAVCENCGAEYGGFAAHTFVNGVCGVCNADDPNYSQPTETRPDETEPTGTSPEATEPAGTAPTGTAPSVPSRPSVPSSPSTTSAPTVTTVTTVTAAEMEIIYEDFTGEEVSLEAAAYADSEDISENSAWLITVLSAAIAAALIVLKKRFF